jgi:hypothetical protein
MIFNKNKKNDYLIIFTIFIILTYFLNSLFFIRDMYGNHDLLHFTEASEFLRGYSLYQEVNVQYGIGTTLLHALALYIFGDNVFSAFLNVNIFYFLSILFIFLICLKFKFNSIDNLFLVLITINIHPFTSHPWPNYIAFLPLVLSLYFLIDKSKLNYFFSGFFLALACLTRDTYLISGIIIFLYIIFESIFKSKNLQIAKFYILGFFIPITAFVCYMLISSNYLVWLELIYPMNRWISLLDLGYFAQTDISLLRRFYIFFIVPYRQFILTFIDSIYYLWFDWILVFAIFFSCTFIFFKRIIKNKTWNENELNKYRFSIISVYSLSFILQMLHIVEIFRFATGSIVGIIILYYLLNSAIKVLKIRIAIYVITLLLLYVHSYGTYLQATDLKKFYRASLNNIDDFFYKPFNKNQNSKNIKKVPEFAHMNYDQSIVDFYYDFKKICEQLVITKGIEYSSNHTNMWELPYFCKTKKKYYYAISSTLAGEEFYKKSYLYNKRKSNSFNTIEFHVSSEYPLKSEIILDDRAVARFVKLSHFKTLYVFDLKKNYPEVFSKYGVSARYFYITQPN